jgi:hypothetical protein
MVRLSFLYTAAGQFRHFTGFPVITADWTAVPTFFQI